LLQLKIQEEAAANAYQGPAVPSNEVIGSELVDLCMDETQQRRSRPIRDALTKEECRFLQNSIRTTVRPPSHRAPPSNLGDEGHGKLKADQWRSLLEFDVPVALAQLWSKESQSETVAAEVAERKEKMLTATMYLSIAIELGTSFSTSRKKAEQYTEYMIKYLQLLLHLYPSMALTANQHTALHVGPLLPHFGPAPGWWMFPFERLIGALQKVNHNYQRGQHSFFVDLLIKPTNHLPKASSR